MAILKIILVILCNKQLYFIFTKKNTVSNTFET